MGVSYFKFNNVTSDSKGLSISRYPDYSVPQRVVTKYTVPGRNGDLIIDSGAYANVRREYEVYLNAKASGFHDSVRDVANWLCSVGGYKKLEDSYDSDIYMMARVDNQQEFLNWMNYMGRANIVFDCKPQRFLKTGDTEITVSARQEITNDYMPSKPLLLAQGIGTIDFQIAGGMSYRLETILTYENPTYIDCETQNAWTTHNNVVTNMNPYVQVEDTGWPVLGGFSSTLIEHNLTSLKVVPRWWTL